MGKWAIGTGAMLVGAVAILVSSVAAGYNDLVRLDHEARAQWAQVEDVYQRRADLVPSIVGTARCAVAFEKEMLTDVTQASSATHDAGDTVPSDPAAFARFEQAQDRLSAALSDLMLVVERHPDLLATQNFRDLKAELEAAENRIAMERMRFNETAQAFNTRRRNLPTVMIAGLFRDRFLDKGYFSTELRVATAPKGKF